MTTLRMSDSKVMTAAGTNSFEVPIPPGEWVLERADMFNEAITGQYADGQVTIQHWRGGVVQALLWRDPLSQMKAMSTVEPHLTVMGGDRIRGYLNAPTYAHRGYLTVYLRKVH